MTQPLITVQALAACKPGSVIIFDCRFNLQDPKAGRRNYMEDHIPGAFYLDLNEHLSSPIKPRGGRHPLPDITKLEQTLCDAGVTAVSHIVVYDDQRFAFAARAWWLLNYVGLTNVQILDGGYSGWRAAGEPTDRRMPSLQNSHFVATEHRHRVCDQKFVKQIIGDKHYTLIDAREARRYQGIEEPIDPVAGHIPGAVNFPWQDVTNEEGFAKSELQQASRWNHLPKGTRPVVYCGSGVTACVDILSLVLSQRYTLDDICLYAGSWSDWCSYGNAVQATH